MHESAFNSLDSNLSDEWIFSDMGFHNFKGISNKARIFQVKLITSFSIVVQEG